MKKYNHAYTIAFSVDSDNMPDDVSAHELYAAILLRVADLLGQPSEIFEATGDPHDTYENAQDGA